MSSASFKNPGVAGGGKPLPFVLSVLWMAILGVVCLVSCTPQESLPAGDRSLNVLVITLDTIRADRLGAYGNIRRPNRLRRRARRPGGPLRKLRRADAADPAVAHLALYGHLPRPARGPGQRQLRRAEGADDDGGALERSGLPHRGVRRRLRAVLTMGSRPGLRDLHRAQRWVRPHAGVVRPDPATRGRRSWTTPSHGSEKTREDRSSPGSTSTIPTSPTTLRRNLPASIRTTPISVRWPTPTPS